MRRSRRSRACKWCGKRFKPASKGPQQLYCRASHRLRAFERRKLAAATDQVAHLRALRQDMRDVLRRDRFREELVRLLREMVPIMEKYLPEEPRPELALVPKRPGEGEIPGKEDNRMKRVAIPQAGPDVDPGLDHTTRLRRYGGRLVAVEGHAVVELAGARHQYRRRGEVVEHRIVWVDGTEAGPWKPMSAADIALMRARRGAYHPILDPLGL